MKPGDFFLGVLDFFAILLPGSLATWLAIQYVPAASLRSALMFGFMTGERASSSLQLGWKSTKFPQLGSYPGITL